MLVTRVLLVARTYPIRVAGNSGPLKNELTWEEISRRVGKQVMERTTVTNKIRRVGEWDEELLDNAHHVELSHLYRYYVYGLSLTAKMRARPSGRICRTPPSSLSVRGSPVPGPGVPH